MQHNIWSIRIFVIPFSLCLAEGQSTYIINALFVRRAQSGRNILAGLLMPRVSISINPAHGCAMHFRFVECFYSGAIAWNL